MNLEEKITEDLKAAMKAKDQAALRTIRAIKSEILLFKTSGSGETLDEKAAIKILQKMAKQRSDSLAIYEKEGRKDLADTEKEELEILQNYLPAQLSDEELQKLVSEVIDQTGATGMKDMGKVMGVISAKVAGRADNKTIAEMVKKSLSG